ncbi:Cytokinin riboside 5'-monophosphate phosphoribohydrolase [Rubrivivax sp. A210]|uniref:LOG family protein n=1 Tax=Rubrivivax sp. A210 TaxID=2772301 RepID=UPI00191B4867|nr:TIGR00730 family Rossman fold protein [Rubrivivax sp. A210]CAD5374721.1 Cytokinin riboside 5'-monophosphate phosphoribohydrolase [Rubrivivax sp. A210]
MATEPLSICVYCGSRHGADPAYTEAARALGAAIGTRGWQLVYGGGKVGLMGEVADAVLAHGGRVIGVIPESLKKLEVGHLGLHELHVVPSMHVRKQMMAERADAFVALPGGIGTLEELYEVWTWRQLGYHASPVGLLNIAGYYDDMLRFMRHTVDQGFLSQAQHDALLVGTEPESLLLELARRLAPGRPKAADYTKV